MRMNISPIEKINSLAFVRYNKNIRNMIFTVIIQNGNQSTHNEIVIKWMPQNLNNEVSTLIQ